VASESRRSGRPAAISAICAVVALVLALTAAPPAAAAATPDNPPSTQAPGTPETPPLLTRTIQALQAGASQARADTVPTDRLLVHVDAGATPAQREAAFADLGAVDERPLGNGWSKLEIGETTTADTAEQRVDSDVVLGVEPDLPVWKDDAAPNDPLYTNGSMWGLTGDWGIRPQPAWNTTTGSSNVVVAVLDTGVDYTHPDLANRVWRNWGEVPGNNADDDGNGYKDDVYGWDFFNKDSTVYDPGDGDAHGTHVAGTIAAQGNNGTGVSGVNWNVQFMPLKFIGPAGGYTSDAITALNYAVANGASVVNASWGGTTYSGALKAAIDAAGNAGVLFVAAAGNEGVNTDVSPHYPSAYTSWNLVSVMSIGSTGYRSGFSNYGRWTVDLGAPGESILSTVPGDVYQYYSGTSMAAPHVSGVAALFKALNPGATWQTVRDALVYRARWDPNIRDQNTTSGVVDASTAVYKIPTWNYGTVDSGTSKGVGSSAIAYADSVYVFNKDVTGHLRAGRLNRWGWAFSNPGPSSCIGTSTAAISYFGWLHVFADADVGGSPALCHLTTKDGVTWYSQILDTGFSTGKGVSVTQYGMQLHVFNYGTGAVAGAGAGVEGDVTPATSYPVLRHNVFDTVGGWASHDLGSAASPSDAKTSSVSFGGELHVFDPQTGGALKHYVWVPSQGRWLNENVASDASPSSGMSIYPTGLGELHIMYGGTGGKLQHRYYNPWSGLWTTETLQNDVVSGGDISTTTFGGAFRVVYGATGTRLGLRTYSAGTWYQEYLDAGSSIGTDGVSAVLYGGGLHIYANGTGPSLRITYWG